VALLFPSDPAGADCALIPTAVQPLQSTTGSVDRPFAAPGDTLTVLSAGACDPSPTNPHFDPLAANNEVTIRFEPPAGGPVTTLPPFPASAVSACGAGRCFAVELQVPDTTDQPGTAVAGTGHPLTGPAVIEVRNQAAGGFLAAEIGPLFEPTAACNPENRAETIFEKFTVLPARNVFSSAASATLHATVDGSGSLLIPIDYTGVLPSLFGGAGALRLLEVGADLPNGLAAGNGLPGADGALLRLPRATGRLRFVRAFSFEGRPIPPLLEVTSSTPLSSGGVEFGDTLLGSVDFVDSVIRIAKVSANPANPMSPLQIFALEGEQTASGLELLNGAGPVLLPGVRLEAGPAAPLNSLSKSAQLAVVARDEALETPFGGGDQNADPDSDDRVVELTRLDSGEPVVTGMAVAETGREPGAPRKAALVTAGAHAAFLQSEAHQGRTDFFADGETLLDQILRVWTSDASHPLCPGAACELTASMTDAGSGLPVGPIAANPSLLIDRRDGRGPLAFSGGPDGSDFVFFGVTEGSETPVDFLRLSVRSGGVETTAPSSDVDLSDDGLYVAYVSEDGNLDSSGMPSTGRQVYLADIFDPFDPFPLRVSADGFGNPGDGDSSHPSVDCCGSQVAFASEASLVPGDVEGQQDVFVLSIGGLHRLSEAGGSGEGGNGASDHPELVALGYAVAFESEASNLVPGDMNGVSDVFVGLVLPDDVSRVSVPDGGGEANGASSGAALSALGVAVAFESEASNLVPGDTNGVSDVFVRDLRVFPARTKRVSVGFAGAEANGPSFDADLSREGVLDPSSSFDPTTIRDGRFVAFASTATNLVAPSIVLNHPQQCYVRDRERGTTELVSRTLGGQGADAACEKPTISPSGRFVSFSSTATNLHPEESPVPGVRAMYIFDRLTGVVHRGSFNGALPADLRTDVADINQGAVAYSTAASDVRGIVDNNLVSDVYGARAPAGPSLNPAGPFPDADSGDTVLHVFDTRDGTLRNTQLPVAQVAVAGGRAAVIPNQSGSVVVWDGVAGGVLKGSGVFADQIALSESVLCMTSGGALWVASPTNPAAVTPFSFSSALQEVKAVHDKCVVREEFTRSLVIAALGESPTGTSQPATDFQVDESGIAFRTCESEFLSDLNGDTDQSDCVMRFWRFAPPAGDPNLVDTGRAAVPCTFPGCDPFFEPYRVDEGLISFTSDERDGVDSLGSGARATACLPTSAAGACDLTGDTDGDDVALEIYSLASRRSQVFPLSRENPPESSPFPEVVPGTDSVLVLQLPAEVLGAAFAGLPPEQPVTVIAGDADEDGSFDGDGIVAPAFSVADNCRFAANEEQADEDRDGMGAECDLTLTTQQANDDPVTSPEPPQIPGSFLCDLNRSGVITRPEVDQVWADRGIPISPPFDHTGPAGVPDGVPDPSDDRDRDPDGAVTSVDFRLCLADCDAQEIDTDGDTVADFLGCPASEPVSGGTPKQGFKRCGLLGIELVLALAPFALARRWRRARRTPAAKGGRRR
jgi:hypothetical protein